MKRIIFGAVTAVLILGSLLKPTLRALVPRSEILDKGENPALASQLGLDAEVQMKLGKMKLMPFTGYHAPSNLREQGIFRGVHYDLKTNSLGFLTPYEFDARHAPPFKGHGRTRVVLVTGGSATWGIGASANDKIVANVLEQLLRKSDPKHDWKVVNMAMAGWNAFQEYVVLDLYGAPFEPDWIVTMDGRNDVMVATAHGEPIPGYYFFRGEKNLNDMFEEPFDEPWYYGLFPVFRHRRFAESLTAISRAPTPVSDLKTWHWALRFYYHSLNSIISRFPKSKILLTTQPSEWAQGRYLNIVSGRIAGNSLQLSYLELLPEVQKIAKSHPNTFYLNGNALFPPDDWNRYFVDDCHMRDAGHAVTAAALAKIILSN